MQEIFNLMRILNPFSKPAFIDTFESLENEFKHSNDNNVVILNVSEVSKHYTVSFFRKKYGGKIIAFNQEPLIAKQQKYMHFKFFNFLKDADEVWDYDERQVAIISTINKNTHLHILQPYKDWSIYETMPKDIDILFYGSLNEHRQKLLNVLDKKIQSCDMQWQTWRRIRFIHCTIKNIIKHSLLLRMRYARASQNG